MDIPQSEINQLRKQVVIHIDMDCFFVQVEQQLQPSLIGKPVCVRQYTNVSTLIAVSYEARSLGVKRGMRPEEARELCKDIILVQVESKRGKADLQKYRDASKKVFSILTSTKCVVERLSIDEGFLDVTSVAQSKLKDAAKYQFIETEPSQKEDFHQKNLPPNTLLYGLQDHEFTEDEYPYFVAAQVAHTIRTEIRETLGYTCSCGIANNKVLAKLATGHNKPNGQTVFLPRSMDNLLSATPISKIPSLGGKLGIQITNDYDCENVKDLRQYSRSELNQYFGTITGDFLHYISYGFSTKKVSKRELPKVIGCSKNFRSLTRSEVENWIPSLSAEISERVEDDIIDNNRYPLSLGLGIYLQKGSKITFERQTPDSPKITAKRHITKSKLLTETTTDPNEISTHLINLYHSIGSPEPVSAIGISYSNFQNGKMKRSGTLESFVLKKKRTAEQPDDDVVCTGWKPATKVQSKSSDVEVIDLC
eukprot:TRINITY_DN10148_c3_g1_i1.p1 TRINITY_DN10148_c3_g1~~TRINITY_DN10148_c3_g1_i1.p1  ORF type:complete len:479 (+),score=73.33 TRINITY_DN10148_c3_g1_i1:74-1510(+)